MPLEIASTIADLVITNPVGASDTPAALDDHIQLIKKVLKADALVDADIGVNVAAQSHNHTGTYAPVGAVTSSGLTQSTAKLLGRTTAGTGAVEEISVSGATLSGGVLSITQVTLASQAEAEGGTENTKTMTALRTKQSIDANAPACGSSAWNNVAVNRALGTTYTNSLSKPIFVYIQLSGTGNNTVTVGGVSLGYVSAVAGSFYGNTSFCVPPGDTYSMSNGGAVISVWVELY